jgi:hypothetical protein
MQNRSVAVRQPIRVRLDQLKRSPSLSPLGIPEMVALTCAALVVVITLVAYFYFLVPAQSRRNSTQTNRDLLQAQLRNAQGKLGQGIDTQTSVDKIRASLEDFEGNWLASPGSGRMTLYKELNNLIRSNGLRNTAGPSYTPLPPIGTKTGPQPSATASQQTNAKWQTVYPGIAVSVTVEGPYQNVRHFVRDIETSREFLIINAVELESVTHTGGLEPLSAPTPRPPAPRPTRAAPVASAVLPAIGDKAALVSLRLDIATYFRQPGTESDSTP